MAEATVARVSEVGGPYSVGPFKKTILDITGTGSYPSGGYAFDGVPWGIKRVIGMNAIGGNAAAAANTIHWDNVNQLLMVIDPTTGAEVSGSITTLTFRVEIIGF